MTATLADTADAPLLPEGDGQPPRPAYPVPEALQPWRDPHRGIGWLLTALVTVLACVTRFWALGFPSTRNFDEAYYAVEA